MIKFSIFIYPKLIVESYIYYIKNLQVISFLKFTVIWPIILTASLLNILFLSIDNLLFSFKNINVKKPLFIIGFPRSGTTFLHKVISKDKQFTTPKLWELLFAPSILQKYIFAFLFIIFKPLKRVGKFFKPFHHSKINDLHEIQLNNPEEDYLAFIPYGACFILILFFPVKDIWDLLHFDDSYDISHKNKLMKIYKRLIQRHLYYHGTDKIYMTKNPSFTSMIESLNLQFPDCSQIVCHREPHKAIASLISSMDHGYQIMSRSVMIDRDVNRYINMFRHYHNIITRKQKLNSNLFLISMDEQKSNLEANVNDVYNRFRYKQSTEFISELSKLSIESKNFISKHKYNLSDYGLNEDEIKEYFSDYYKVI